MMQYLQSKAVVFVSWTFAVLIFVTLSGCFDPDPTHYTTPLPNGLQLHSNGGHLGRIGTPFVNNISTPVYPSEEKWFCNEFNIVGDDVIGVEIQYGRRANIDPPVATRWFYLDTKKRTAKTFDSLDALRKYCKSLGHADLPEFVRRTAETREREL